MEQTTLPKDSLILITGVNGAIASHCADQALAAGYRVRGTVRGLSKAEQVKALFEKKYGEGRFEVVEVPQMEANDAFATAIDGCAAVIHCASVLTFGSDPEQVIPPTVAGAREVLKAAAGTPSVRKVVYTSSTAAVHFPQPNVAAHVTSETWNTAAAELARTGFPGMEASFEKGGAVYAASKLLAEKACWDFMKEEPRHFAFNAVVPNFNSGPILCPNQSRSSAGMIHGTWMGEPQAMAVLKGLGTAEFYIDVRDDARLHLAAATFEDVKGERLLGMVEPINFNRILDAFGKIDPQHELPPRESETQNLITADARRSEELIKRLGRSGWIGFEDSVRASVESDVGKFEM